MTSASTVESSHCVTTNLLQYNNKYLSQYTTSVATLVAKKSKYSVVILSGDFLRDLSSVYAGLLYIDLLTKKIRQH